MEMRETWLLGREEVASGSSGTETLRALQACPLSSDPSEGDGRRVRARRAQRASLTAV